MHYHDKMPQWLDDINGIPIPPLIEINLILFIFRMSKQTVMKSTQTLQSFKETFLEAAAKGNVDTFMSLLSGRI